MPQQIDPNEYERATAIVTHATLTRSVANAYPSMTMEEFDAMIVGILDRIARMRGWAIRREHVMADEDAES